MGMVTGSGNTAIHQLFSYDSSGNVVSVDYSSNGGSTFTTYYYLRNAQNDIVKIIDGSGNTVVQYTYDSWGKPIGVTGTLASTLGANQPFRYRGYVYDTETGWYYLQSRYYDPSICRFISADVLLSTTQGVIGNNSFAYCGNDPINRLDDEGAFWETVFDVISLVASVAEVVANPADPWAWAGLAGDAIDLIPFVSGVGEVTRAVKLVDKAVDVADNLHDAGKLIDKTKTVVKVHGNSLETTKKTFGYALRRNGTDEIMKYGETTRGTLRYTKEFYKKNDVYMDIMNEGSKREMHFWQHEKILEYYKKYNRKPPMNKSFW